VEETITSMPEEGQTSSFQSEVHGNVHFEFIPKGKTVNQPFCSDVSHCIQEEVLQKQPK
jgi:hypothetical protein